jgi:hypothetical protein
MGTAKTELDRNTQPGRPGTQRLVTRMQELSLKSKCGQENDIATPRWSPLWGNGSARMVFCVRRRQRRDVDPPGLGSHSIQSQRSPNSLRSNRKPAVIGQRRRPLRSFRKTGGRCPIFDFHSSIEPPKWMSRSICPVCGPRVSAPCPVTTVGQPERQDARASAGDGGPTA